MSDEPLLVRPATREDAGRIATLFREAYQQTSHPCAQAENVARGLARGEKWLVCEQGDELVACTALIPHDWNATFEVGRSVTRPLIRARGLGRLIYRDSLRWAVELGTQDFVVGWPRNATMCRMLCERTTPPAYLFGHDGGANVANGIREAHAVALVGATRPCRRAGPRFGPGLTPLFRERIEQLGFQDVTAPAAPELIVGPPGTRSYETSTGTGLCYCLTETSRGWSVLVTELRAPAAEADQVLAGFMADNPAIRQVACYVLWDKLPLIARLGALGYRATAYLPAWYARDGVRHDCLQLSWLAPGETTDDNGMADLLNPLLKVLAEATAPSYAACGEVGAQEKSLRE